MDKSPPQLPSQVSKDGSEIWDWADDFSSWVHKQDKIARLEADIRDLSARRCGSCRDWMKSRQCPREKNVDGVSKGPSMSAPACQQFARKVATQSLIDERLSELEIARTPATPKETDHAE